MNIKRAVENRKAYCLNENNELVDNDLMVKNADNVQKDFNSYNIGGKF